MASLKLLIHVRPEKRREFMLSVAGLLPQAESRRSPCQVFQSIGDENLICVLSEYETSSSLEQYLQSDSYRALVGAVNALGCMEDISILDSRPV